MSISDKLLYLDTTKQLIKQAIIDKGVEITEADSFRSYAAKIGEITTQWQPTAYPADAPDIVALAAHQWFSDHYLSSYQYVFLFEGEPPTGIIYTGGDAFDYYLSYDDDLDTVYSGTNTHVMEVNHTYTGTGKYSYVFLSLSSDIDIVFDALSGVRVGSFIHAVASPGSRRFIAHPDVYSVSGQTFSRNNILQEVSIPEAVYSPPNYMFQYCYALRNVSTFFIKDTYKDFTNMFYYCRSLVKAPQLNTSHVETFYRTFYYCFSLREAPNFDYSSALNMQEMFRTCSALTYMPAMNTPLCQNMASLFNACSSLREIEAIDTSSATDVSYIFNSCELLKNIPALNLPQAATAKSMFNNCKNIQQVTLTNTENVTDFTYTFSGCESLLTVSPIDTRAATSNRNMFSSCRALETLQFLDPDETVDPHSYSFIDDPNFGSCSYLTVDSIVGVFKRLRGPGDTITISQTLDNKLTNEQREIATNKGWTISVNTYY